MRLYVSIGDDYEGGIQGRHIKRLLDRHRRIRGMDSIQHHHIMSCKSKALSNINMHFMTHYKLSQCAHIYI